MNKVTLAFAAATAGLTRLSIHLWRQLDVEQHRELQTLIADGASTLPVQEQYVRQAEEFVRRQRQRAAEVLNERQLRVFVRMQDELLARERLEARTTTLVEQGV
jgi:hypothetical protein